MKKTYIFLLVVLLALAFSSASAQEERSRTNLDVDVNVETQVRLETETEVRGEPVRTQPGPTLEDRRKEMEERRLEAERRQAESRQLMEDRRERAETVRVDNSNLIALRQSENLFRVMSATINRLEKIGDRIQSRIDKLKTAGGNTSESERHLAAARGNLAEARVSLEVFVGIDLSGENLQDNLQRIRGVAAEVRGHIRSAHENLMRSVRLLGQVEASLRTEASVESN